MWATCWKSFPFFVNLNFAELSLKQTPDVSHKTCASHPCLDFNYMAAAIQAAYMGNFLHTYSKLCRSRSTLYLFSIFSYLAITSLVKSSEAKSRSFLPVPKIPLVVSCKAVLQADWTALKCSICRAHFLNLCNAAILPENFNFLHFTPSPDLFCDMWDKLHKPISLKPRTNIELLVSDQTYWNPRREIS